MNFLDELLAEVEQKQAVHKLEMDRLKADQLLQLAEKLEGEIAAVNKLADDEVSLIEQYRQSETTRVQRKLNWIVFQLDGFARSLAESEDIKTIRLPRGILKLRQGRDRCEISDESAFMKVAGRLGLLRTVPAESKPDLAGILSYIKRTGGDLPAGVTFIPGQQRFSYSLTRNGGTENVED